MRPTGQAVTRRRICGTCLLAAWAWLSSTVPAAAQHEGFGVRAGVSADPDQFVVGLHYDTGRIVERLTVRPNVALGLGDDLTLVAFNLEFAYWIPLKRQPWQLYVGGGPAINVYSFDKGGGPERGDGDTDIEPGFNVLFGITHTRGFFFEMKVGAIDSPDFTAIVGYAFGR